MSKIVYGVSIIFLIAGIAGCGEDEEEPGEGLKPIEILYIEFDAPDNDNENLNGEWVEISNPNDEGIDMTGFTLSDDANHLYTFRHFVLPGRASVKVFTGSGMDTESSLYWGSKRAIWNNDGDTAYLKDDDGTVIDEYSY